MGVHRGPVGGRIVGEVIIGRSSSTAIPIRQIALVGDPCCHRGAVRSRKTFGWWTFQLRGRDSIASVALARPCAASASDVLPVLRNVHFTLF